MKFSRPRLETTWRYVKVEFKPPTPGEIPEISKAISHIISSAATGKFGQLTVKQGLANSIVCFELVILFFIGEVIGRGTLVGYDVSRIPPKFPLW